MKKSVSLFLTLILLFSLVFPISTYAEIGDNDYIDVIIEYNNEEGKQKIISNSLKVSNEFEYLSALAVSITNEQLELLENDSDIGMIEQNKVISLSNTTQINKDDLTEEVQWNQELLNTSIAWQEGYTGKEINIAVVDTGISPNSEMIIEGGISTVEYTNSWYDDNGHGTHVAGIIGAKKDDKGISGISPDANLYSIKAIDAIGKGNLIDLLEAIEWSIQNKMDIINLSLSLNQGSEYLRLILEEAYDKGILIVASAGNDGNGNGVTYPARYDSVIGIGSIDKEKNLSSFSTTGSAVEFVAPGEEIVSTYIDAKYASLSGTSQASAHVTGFLALLKQKFPKKSNQELREELTKNILDLGENGKDSLYGNGIIRYSPVNTNSMEKEENTKYFKVTSNNVKVYESNSQSSSLLGELIIGQEYEHKGINGDYYQIQYGSTVGYVHKDNTEVSNGNSIKNKSSENQTYSKKVPISKRLTIYDNTSGAFEPFGVIEEGTNYDVILGSKYWWKISFANRIGYIHRSGTIEDTPKDSSYFKVITDEATIYDIRTKNKGYKAVGKLVKGQEYKHVGTSGNYYKIKYDSYYGYVHQSNVKSSNGSSIKNIQKNESVSDITFLTKSDIKVYDNTSGTFEPFGVIEEGTNYDVISGSKYWWKISFANRIGYVHRSGTIQEFSKDSDYFEVTSDEATIYDIRTKNKGYKAVGKLVKGQEYKRVGVSGNYYKIKFDTYYGYIHQSNIKASNGSNIKNTHRNEKNSGISFHAKQDLTVYDNTSGTFKPFGIIEEGTNYDVISGSKYWWKIIFANRIGYVHRSGTIQELSKDSNYFEVTSDEATIYDIRTVNGGFKEVGKLIKGQEYKHVGVSGNYYKIKFDSYYGYIHQSNLKASNGSNIKNTHRNEKNSGISFRAKQNLTVYDNTSGSFVPFGVIEEGTNYNVISGSKYWWKISFANRIGYVHLSGTVIEFSEEDEYFEVTTENATVYDIRTGNGSYNKIGELIKGQSYRRIGSSGNYHKIKFGQHYGYIHQTQTQPTLNDNITNMTRNSFKLGKFTTKTSVSVYDNTSSGSFKVFASIEKGIEMPVVNQSGDWLEVNISGRYGFVHKSQVDAELMVAKNLVNPRQEYTYEEMRTDISELVEAYPGLITSESIGKSVDGRDIYAVKLGKGKKEIFLNGSTHAREWLTTNLLMEMIDEYSQSYVNNKKYDGYDVRELLNHTSIWFVPMVNPDGVSLVQKGAASAKNPSMVRSINYGSNDFRAWKANIRGVDLNRQFPTNWYKITNDPGNPAPFNFAGYKPLTEPEAIAFYNFTKKHNFLIEVDYHSSGEILYFGDDLLGINNALHRKSKAVAEKVSAKTGYPLYYTRNVSGGGRRADWSQQVLGRVVLTPEVSPHVGNRPVPVSYFDSIWRKNDSVGLMLANEAYRNF